MCHAPQGARRCSTLISFKSGQRLTIPRYISKNDALFFFRDFMTWSVSEAATLNELMTVNEENETITK